LKSSEPKAIPIHDNTDFFQKVYAVVAKIPSGKVTTYGAVAEVIGIRSSARMVGWALNAKAGNFELPCHRVVNRNGDLSGKHHFPTPTMMYELLVAEGIEFNGDRVNMKKHLWKPELNIISNLR
jgi:methylated-DNA-protein-cysteine methyltransferase related protein